MKKSQHIFRVLIVAFIAVAPVLTFGAINSILPIKSGGGSVSDKNIVNQDNSALSAGENTVITPVGADNLDYTGDASDNGAQSDTSGVVDAKDNEEKSVSGVRDGHTKDIDILSGSINEDSEDEYSKDEGKETPASNQGERVMMPEYGADKNSDHINISAREVRGWDPDEKREFLETVKEYAQVRSGQDLENFAKGVLLNDENIKSIEASENKVRIEYKTPAKFLGIFNSSIAVRAEVSEVEKVKVKFPWYGFLFKKAISTNDIESELEASLPEIGDEVLVSFESRARALTIISNVLKIKHDTAKSIINNVR